VNYYGLYAKNLLSTIWDENSSHEPHDLPVGDMNFRHFGEDYIVVTAFCIRWRGLSKNVYKGYDQLL
jgi:hypothetical protein